MALTDYATMFRLQDFNRLTIKTMDMMKPSQHPFFLKHQCFQQKITGIDMEVLIKYICLFYDPRSPLLDKFNDHLERKRAAAVIAGFKPKGEMWTPEIESVMYCNDDDVTTCILEYLRALHTDSWSVICTSREALFRIQKDLISEAVTTSDKGSTRTSVDIAKTRTDLALQTEQMADRLNTRMLNFLAQDESPYLRKGLFNLIDRTRKLAKISPERIAFQ